MARRNTTEAMSGRCFIHCRLARKSYKKVFLIEVKDRLIETITGIFLKKCTEKKHSIHRWMVSIRASIKFRIERHVMNRRKNFKETITGVHTNAMKVVIMV